MFNTDIEKTVIGSAIALWVAHGWYLNTRLEAIHRKLDLVLDNFGGLRDYLYENDPQFDEERALMSELGESLEDGTVSFPGMNHMELIKRKEECGRRTLDTPFVDRAIGKRRAGRTRKNEL